ncbi:DUF3108 domain-containing protein [Roseateles sp. DAIF2]|uniref:DUF3108 domain-containing protein n=1 Tax=Roseateles sp. DAIF2 TaxID=2714952 RepID=UPI0018A2906E|nr:DUF3108 domain-containing protein [Roseateles sp. DAIF2]QPF72704.1 DUF3108 domain-containing protein [Roseateles sp. DAIF2]
MAGRLNCSLTRRRAGAALLLLAAVLLMHALFGRLLWRLHEDWLGEAASAPPPRLAVAFVRELSPQVVKTPPRPMTRRLPPPLASAELAPGLPAELPAAAIEPPAAPEPLGDLALPEPPPDAAEPGPEWPASTRLRYTLNGHYRGEVNGEAEVQWLREGRRYQVHLEVRVGASFAPLISRRMSSDGLLTAAGIAPERYDEDTKMLLRERQRVTVRFDREGQVLRLPRGPAQPLPAGAQDAASQFVQLTWLFLTGRERLEPGRVLELPLALPRRLYQWRYEVVGEELLYTPMGPLPAWHLRPQLERLPRTSDLKAEVWLAPGLQYLPVRLRIAQDEQTYIDLMLKAPPLQAAQ